jgi:hypothetical protein
LSLQSYPQSSFHFLPLQSSPQSFWCQGVLRLGFYIYSNWVPPIFFSLSFQCKDFIDEFIPEIFNELKKMDPDTICKVTIATCWISSTRKLLRISSKKTVTSAYLSLLDISSQPLLKILLFPALANQTLSRVQHTQWHQVFSDWNQSLFQPWNGQEMWRKYSQ